MTAAGWAAEGIWWLLGRCCRSPGLPDLVRNSGSIWAKGLIMGQMRFRLHDRDRFPPNGLERIYVAGSENIPWATQVRWDGEQLVLERLVSDSGSVYVPWQVDGHGLYQLGTTTLIERDQPYLLVVELARGLIQRIRNRQYFWELLGLKTPVELNQQLDEATREFSRSATSQQDMPAASAAANRALSLGMAVASELVACYSQQSITARQRQTSISTLLGTTLGPKLPPVGIRRQLVDACNIIQIPIAWREIESREGKRNWKQTDEQLGWCQTAGLKISAGPLLQMDDQGVPDWMVLWEDDFDNLARLMLEHVRTVVSRYAGRVHLWHVASRVNNGVLLSLDEEQRLQLVARALQLTKKIDPRTPMVVSFDQPWGEYLANQDRDLAPLHFADALLRADLGISGFGLEINAGYHPKGSPHRSAIEFGQLLDQWSQMGLPLMVLLSTASDKQTDRSPSCSQQAWGASLVPMLLARTSVQVVLWNQLSDKHSPEFPGSGLFDEKGEPKPLLKTLRELRKNYLQ